MTKETLDKFFKMYNDDVKYKIELELFLKKYPRYREILIKEPEVKPTKKKRKVKNG